MLGSPAAPACKDIGHQNLLVHKNSNIGTTGTTCPIVVHFQSAVLLHIVHNESRVQLSIFIGPSGAHHRAAPHGYRKSVLNKLSYGPCGVSDSVASES